MTDALSAQNLVVRLGGRDVLADLSVRLEPGQVILGGSFTRPVPARPGDTFHCDYGPLGSIACHFV